MLDSNDLVLSVKTPVFMAKEFLHRLPDPRFRHGFSPLREDVDLDEALADLKRDGIVSFRGYFSGEFLNRLQDRFELIIAEYSTGGGINPECDLCENLLQYDRVFLEAALDSTLLELMSRYYRKGFGIGRADAMRIRPLEESRYGSFQWHHDTRGLQLKAQVLLTDVAEDGQRMTYLKGTHATYYTRKRGRGPGSRFEFDMNARPDIAKRVVNVAVPAGTVTLFDTNGLHSGNRNMTATRDNITIYYPTAGNFKEMHYQRAHLEGLPEEKRRVITFNPLHKFVQ